MKIIQSLPRGRSALLALVLFGAFAGLLALAFRDAVWATAGSHAGGGAGTHNTGSHAQNPSHSYISVLSPIHATKTSSGGKYHDTCVDVSYPPDGTVDICNSGAGGDWSVDIAGTGGMYLYLDWIGYSGGSVYPDLSRPLAVYAWGQLVGYVGGDTMSFAMWDNPFYFDH